MSNPIRVLWIEDDTDWLAPKVISIEEILLTDNIKFDHYPLENGDYLEENFKYYPDFKIALVDYGLANLNGPQVVKKILDYKRDCRVILYSFDENLDLRGELLKALNEEERVLGIFSFASKKEIEEVLIELIRDFHKK